MHSDNHRGEETGRVNDMVVMLTHLHVAWGHKTAGLWKVYYSRFDHVKKKLKTTKFILSVFFDRFRRKLQTKVKRTIC